MRKPSAETELRSLRRDLREAKLFWNQYQREAMTLRGQLNKSQGETAEWKRRFDLLLAKAKSFDVPTPEKPL
jgi:hypothetical protein